MQIFVEPRYLKAYVQFPFYSLCPDQQKQASGLSPWPYISPHARAKLSRGKHYVELQHSSTSVQVAPVLDPAFIAICCQTICLDPRE